MLIARLFSGRIGERFAANVVAAKPFGLVVQLSGMGISGPIASEALPGGPWRFEAATQSFAAGRRRYEIGQPLSVVVTATDEALGRIEFEPVKRSN